MALDPQSLLNGAPCLNCIGLSLAQQIKIALLLQIAQTQGTAVNVQSLIDQAGCLTCMGVDLGSAIEIVLLNIVAASAGAGCVPTTSGDPEGVLTSPCTPALAVDPATRAIYLYTGVAGGNTGWQLKV